MQRSERACRKVSDQQSVFGVRSPFPPNIPCTTNHQGTSSEPLAPRSIRADGDVLASAAGAATPPAPGDAHHARRALAERRPGRSPGSAAHREVDGISPLIAKTVDPEPAYEQAIWVWVPRRPRLVFRLLVEHFELTACRVAHATRVSMEFSDPPYRQQVSERCAVHVSSDSGHRV